MNKKILKNIIVAGGLCLLICTPTLAESAKDQGEKLEAEEAALLAELRAGINLNNQEIKSKVEVEEPEAETNRQVFIFDENSTIVAKEESLDEDQIADSESNNEVASVTVNNSGEVNRLQSSLTRSESQIAKLMAKLKQQRNDLLMAEAEVARLSRILEKQRHSNLRSVTGSPVIKPVRDARKVASTPQQAEKMTADMTIATVTANKANLRTGPGKNNSPLMTVSKGTRLAIETRNGEWYRVIAPTGARAWIASSVVSFGKSRLAEPTRTVSIQGYVDATDEDAFQLINQNSK